jgi:hypothetical protein
MAPAAVRLCATLSERSVLLMASIWPKAFQAAGVQGAGSGVILMAFAVAH